MHITYHFQSEWPQSPRSRATWTKPTIPRSNFFCARFNKQLNKRYHFPKKGIKITLAHFFCNNGGLRCDNVCVQSATQWTLRYILYTCPNQSFPRSIFKNQLRRIGKLGRMSPKTSHIDVLAVRRLLEKPGLATCIAALARYRKSRAGQLGHAPGDAYDITKDKESISTSRDK